MFRGAGTGAGAGAGKCDSGGPTCSCTAEALIAVSSVNSTQVTFLDCHGKLKLLVKKIATKVF